jgi:hypothetical protein
MIVISCLPAVFFFAFEAVAVASSSEMALSSNANYCACILAYGGLLEGLRDKKIFA